MSTILAAATQQPELLQQVQGFLVGVAALAAACAGLWKLKPTRTIILRLVKSTTTAATDWLDKRINRGVKLGTNDIRRQVLPDKGEMSVQERLYRLEQAQEALNSRIKELQDDLEQGRLEECPKSD